MNKFWIVMSHTYMTRFKTKSFLISTIISLLFVVGLTNYQAIFDSFSNDSKSEIAILDETGEFFTSLEKSVEDANEDVDLIAYKKSVEVGKSAVEDEKFDALIRIEKDENQLPQATYYANNIADSAEQTAIQQQLQQLKVQEATKQAGIDQGTITAIYSPVAFDTVALDKSAKTSEELTQARVIVYIMLFILYLFILSYGIMIATDVATEKSSRVMELLVSSVSPVTHMFAKIVGIALLGLTQFGLLVGLGYVLITSKQDELAGGILGDLGNISPTLYIYAVVFFILGYLLYATLAAMLGSLVSRTEDVQQLIMPMTFLVMIAFFIAMFGLSAPETSLVVISSYIPFFAPMLMFLRIGMLNIPFWEVAISLGILVATIILLAIIGARVYKGGVLMYGKSSSLKDFKKAMALSKKE